MTAPSTLLYWNNPITLSLTPVQRPPLTCCPIPSWKWPSAPGATVTRQDGESLRRGDSAPVPGPNPLGLRRVHRGENRELDPSHGVVMRPAWSVTAPKAGAWVAALPETERPAAESLLALLGRGAADTLPCRGETLTELLRAGAGAAGLLVAIERDADRTGARAGCCARTLVRSERNGTAIRTTARALTCGGWTCRYCGAELARAERARLTNQRRADALRGESWTRLVLTLAPGEVPEELVGHPAAVAVWMAGKVWPRTVQRWRRNCAVGAMWRGVEWQANGLPHMNALVRAAAGTVDGAELLREARAAGWGPQGYAGEVVDYDATIVEIVKLRQIAPSYPKGLRVVEGTRGRHAWWSVRAVKQAQEDRTPAEVTPGVDPDVQLPPRWLDSRIGWEPWYSAVHRGPMVSILAAGNEIGLRFVSRGTRGGEVTAAAEVPTRRDGIVPVEESREADHADDDDLAPRCVPPDPLPPYLFAED